MTDVSSCAAQRIQDTLGLWLGEWFLDTTVGAPWRSIVGQKNPNLTSIRASIRALILAVPNVISAVVDVSLNRPLRALTITWAAGCSDGATINGTTTQGAH